MRSRCCHRRFGCYLNCRHHCSHHQYHHHHHHHHQQQQQQQQHQQHHHLPSALDASALFPPRTSIIIPSASNCNITLSFCYMTSRSLMLAVEKEQGSSWLSCFIIFFQGVLSIFSSSSAAMSNPSLPECIFTIGVTNLGKHAILYVSPFSHCIFVTLHQHAFSSIHFCNTLGMYDCNLSKRVRKDRCVLPPITLPKQYRYQTRLHNRPNTLSIRPAIANAAEAGIHNLKINLAFFSIEDLVIFQDCWQEEIEGREACFGANIWCLLHYTLRSRPRISNGWRCTSGSASLCHTNYNRSNSMSNDILSI